MKGNFDTDPQAGQVLIGQSNMGYEPKTIHGDGTVDKDGLLTVSGGGSGITGLTAGFIPLAGSATTIDADSHIDDGVTTPATLTASEKLSVQKHVAIGDGATVQDAAILFVSETVTDQNQFHAIDLEPTYNPTVPASGEFASIFMDAEFNLDGQANDVDFIAGIDSEIYNNSNARRVTSFVGGYFEVGNEGTGPIGELIGVEASASNDGTAIVDLCEGIKVDPIINNGTITSLIGIAVSDITEGVTNYAIKTGAGLVEFGDTVKCDKTLRSGTVYSIAGTALPSAVTEGVGARAFVSDAVANTFNTAYVGGGANKVPVFSDGAVWYIG